MHFIEIIINLVLTKFPYTIRTPSFVTKFPFFFVNRTKVAKILFRKFIWYLHIWFFACFNYYYNWSTNVWIILLSSNWQLRLRVQNSGSDFPCYKICYTACFITCFITRYISCCITCYTKKLHYMLRKMISIN